MKAKLLTREAWKGRTHNLIIISISTIILFVVWAIFLYDYQKPSTVQAVCQDIITNCWCASGQQVCSHQQSDCTIATEVHNEMPGANNCQVSLNSTASSIPSSTPVPTICVAATSSPTPTPSLSPSPSGSVTTTLIIGVGGGPGSSSSPNVVAVQGNNQAGELPRTGVPLAGLALMGLSPLGLKLKNFRSRFFGHSDPNLIWSEKQLKK